MYMDCISRFLNDYSSYPFVLGMLLASAMCKVEQAGDDLVRGIFVRVMRNICDLI
jgi:hypothetical protein